MCVCVGGGGGCGGGGGIQEEIHQIPRTDFKTDYYCLCLINNNDIQYLTKKKLI